uniref:Uncharacterized protein n=1 Tax=Arundo donax TaxID=35708 RepID=A0A0A9FQG9_ARUDO
MVVEVKHSVLHCCYTN